MATISGDITGLHWLNPTGTPGDALVKGVQAGGIIGRSLLAGQEMRQRAQLEAQQQAAILPLREAQKEYYLQRTSLELKEQTDKAQADINMRQGFSELSSVVSNVNEYPENWRDSNFKRDLWQVVVEHPEVAKHPAFGNILDNFTLADRADERRRAAEAELAYKEAALAEKVLADEAELDYKALKIGADIEKSGWDGITSSEVTRRQRDEWIADRSVKLQELEGLSPVRATARAMAEREAAEGRTRAVPTPPRKRWENGKWVQ